MAVPKRKMSKARRDSRRANWKLEVPGYVAHSVTSQRCLIMYAQSAVIMMARKLFPQLNNPKSNEQDFISCLFLCVKYLCI